MPRKIGNVVAFIADYAFGGLLVAGGLAIIIAGSVSGPWI
jgi:hypothetical protein